MKKIILIAIILLTLLLTITACGGYSATPLAGEDTKLGIEEVAREGVFESVPQDAPTTKSDFAADIPQIERIVIKNADLTIAVISPPDSMDRISRMAEEMGGFVVSANLYQTRLSSGAEAPRASVTIRVPAERLNEAIERIKDETDQPVVNENVSSQDVTEDYTDLKSRLRNLEAAEEQLMEIMDSATKPEDVLSVFNQLTQVREQIEVFKGQIQYYEQSAALSSIRAELLPNEAVQPLSIGGWQPVGVARDALQALIRAGQFLATAAIYIVLLILPVLAIIIIPIYLVVRGLLRWRRRRKAEVSEPASSSE
jgi:hypothetical protein